jgi:tetratricopeptide (TPR) repeat protein
MEAVGAGDSTAAVPFLQQAIRLDPRFALAYATLGTSLLNNGEWGSAAENIQRAYDLRAQVSESERLTIEARYEDTVTGDLEKARQIYEPFVDSFPRNVSARNDLGYVFLGLGQYEQALTEFRKAQLLHPESGQIFANYACAFMYLNRFDDARATAQEAQKKGLDSPDLGIALYWLAFAQGDVAGMGRQLSYGLANPTVQHWFLAGEADTAAYSGRIIRARDFTRRAVESAGRVDLKETAASFDATSAVREALYGRAEQAKQYALVALKLSTGRDVKYFAALALAIGGDVVKGHALAQELGKQFPKDTLVQFNFLPVLNAQIALDRNDLAGALQHLQSSASYELGSEGAVGAINPSLYPIYFRGVTLLASHRGTEAAAEFQKIVDHRGLVLNSPIGALAHLQIGRAYVMVGDKVKAKAAYGDFLTLWKDADSDIPILKQAKAEFSKLQ